MCYRSRLPPLLIGPWPQPTVSRHEVSTVLCLCLDPAHLLLCHSSGREAGPPSFTTRGVGCVALELGSGPSRTGPPGRAARSFTVRALNPSHPGTLKSGERGAQSGAIGWGRRPGSAARWPDSSRGAHGQSSACWPQPGKLRDAACSTHNGDSGGRDREQRTPFSFKTTTATSKATMRSAGAGDADDVVGDWDDRRATNADDADDDNKCGDSPSLHPHLQQSLLAALAITCSRGFKTSS